MNDIDLIDEHTVIRETIGYRALNTVRIEDIPETIKFLKVIYNYTKMHSINKTINEGETTMGEINNNNNNPGTSINMDDLRSCISLYLDAIESYGEEGEHEEAINVLNDFVEYIDSMNGRGATPIVEKQNIE